MTTFINPYSKHVIRGQGFSELFNFKTRPTNGKVTFSLTAGVPKDSILEDISKIVNKKKKYESDSSNSYDTSSEVFNTATGKNAKRKKANKNARTPKNSFSNDMYIDDNFSSVSGNGVKQKIDNKIVSDIIGKVKTGKGFYDI